MYIYISPLNPIESPIGWVKFPPKTVAALGERATGVPVLHRVAEQPTRTPPCAGDGLQKEFMVNSAFPLVV